jgi:alkylhydroperoxidase family enzyme
MRFPLLTDADTWARLPETEGARSGLLPAWARALATTLPRTTAATLEVDLVQRTRSPLDPKLRAWVRWTAARANKSPYGEAYALADLLAAGGAETDRETLSATDRLTLEFARKLTLHADKITDEEVAELREIHGEANLVALVQCVAYANFQDRLVLSLGLDVEETGPLPPVGVRFRKPYTGGATPPPRTPPVDAPWQRSDEGPGVDFAALRTATEAQKDRPPRIRVPTSEEVRRHLPAGFTAEWTLKINWSRVCLGYQPELALAWTNGPRTFAAEANQDLLFEESLFWVVTSSLQCFY